MLMKVKKEIYTIFIKSIDLEVKQFTLYLYNNGSDRLTKGYDGTYSLTTGGITIVEFDNMEFSNYNLELYKNNRMVAIL